MNAKKRTLIILLILMLLPFFAAFAEEAIEPVTETASKEAVQDTDEPEGVLFEGQLNINTATINQFALLPGLDRLEAKRIIDYRTKNGNFGATDDLLKVWGVRRLEFARIEKYLVLEGDTTLRRKRFLTPVEGKLNINTASAEEMVRLPGLDILEARNIVEHRTANGDFQAVDDVLKVQGIRRIEFARFKNFLVLTGETTLQWKRPLALVKGKVNINTGTVEEFASLPGIDRFEAKRIVEYRTENGNFNAIDDLLKVRGIRRIEYTRFKDFLTLEGETTLKKKIGLNP